MRNCLVMGAGRSGTSMVAGSLSSAGYFMGHRLIPPTPSNPKGYFESFDIQEINESLLASVVPFRPSNWLLPRWVFSHRLGRNQLWLAEVPLEQHVSSSTQIDKAIRQITANRPFCFKDPRFCYTLPVWRPFLPDTCFICVFRDPAVTIASVLKDCRDSAYLRDITMTHQRAVNIWMLMYRHILDVHRYEGEWFFMHYEQGFSKDGILRLEALTGAGLNRAFPDPSLKRSRPSLPVPIKAQEIYLELCDLAEYKI